VRRGASVGATDAPAEADGTALEATCPGVGDAPAMGPGTARMLATIQAVNKPPATARTNTTTAAMTQPIAPFDVRGRVAFSLGADVGGGAEGPVGVGSSVTRGE
jgi:hypothetical protein